MTVVVPGVGVITRKPKWKQLLLPVEIPAARFSCLTSGSFRPRLGLCILLLVLAASFVFFVAPFLATNLKLVRVYYLGMPASDKLKGAVTSDGRFSAELYNEVKSGSENHVVSSLGVGSVMGMILAGAKGDTAKQIRLVLRHDRDEDVLRGFEGVVGILRDLEKRSEFVLRAANRVFLDGAFAPLPEYLGKLKIHFSAEPKAVDFVSKPEEARKEINGWVEHRTGSKVVDLLPAGCVGPATVSVLVNAIYFKGDWARKFDPEETEEADFHVNEDTTVRVPMMRQKAKFGLAELKELDGAVALRMPYKGDALDMFFILPKEGATLDGMEDRLKDVDFGTRLNKLSNTDVIVSVPRFKVESAHHLKEVLTRMGMADVFDAGKADLSGVAGAKNLFVSKVEQKAFIEVNEDGAEAAAATAGMMMMRAMPMEMSFECNRPFYFMVRERTSGLVLFSGRVTNPKV